MWNDSSLVTHLMALGAFPLFDHCELHGVDTYMQALVSHMTVDICIQALVNRMAVDICIQAFMWIYTSFLLSTYPSLPAHMATLCLTVG